MKFENSEYDTFGVIKKLDGIYNFQSSNVKMMALAMSHYQPKNYHPGTFVLTLKLVRVALDYGMDIWILAGKMIADIVNDLHQKVVEVGMEKGWVYRTKNGPDASAETGTIW